jgi:hypothetical protein
MIQKSYSTLRWPAMSFGVKNTNFWRLLCHFHQIIMYLLLLKCVIGRNYICSDLRISPLWFGCKWGLWDVSSSQNIQHDLVFHPVTCSGGTRIPSLEVVSVRSCWYKKIVMYLVTAWHLKMGPIGCWETSFTSSLCCPTCQKSGDSKLFCYAEFWRWSLLYLGLIIFWTPSIVWCSKQNKTFWKFVLFLFSGKKLGLVESGVFMHFSGRPNWECTFCFVMLCFLVKGFMTFQRNVVPSFSLQEYRLFYETILIDLKKLCLH